MPLPVAQELRALGHDVLTVAESGKSNSATPDLDVLEFSTQENRVLVTLNRRHFIRLHKTVPTHAGIIVCTFDPEFVRQAKRIHKKVAARKTMHGRLERVNRPAK